MSKGLKTILIAAVVAVLIFIPVIGSYNRMVALEQAVNQSQSDIDTQLQRRLDLVPNLVETVKGYAAQEKEILTAVAEARSKLAGSTTITERAEADNELSGALSRLLVVVENYPNLKSDQNFRDLSVALEGTENRISIARKDYNNIVGQYNTTVRRFPGSIVAGLFGFEQKPYYKAAQGAQEVPKVDFSPVK
jgi:LemA protein